MFARVERPITLICIELIKGMGFESYITREGDLKKVLSSATTITSQPQSINITTLST
jgi:hypothetical protein